MNEGRIGECFGKNSTLISAILDETNTNRGRDYKHFKYPSFQSARDPNLISNHNLTTSFSPYIFSRVFILLLMTPAKRALPRPPTSSKLSVRQTQEMKARLFLVINSRKFNRISLAHPRQRLNIPPQFRRHNRSHNHRQAI